MCNSYTAYPKILTALLLVCLLPAFGDAEQLPTAQDINNLADSAKSAIDTFEQQTFRLRMQYQYSNRFLSDGDRENLRVLADAAGEKLAEIAKKQIELKQQIEDYTGDDWDNRYGTTALWRKVTADLYATKLTGYEIDYWRALASEQAEQLRILKNILTEIERLDLKSLPPSAQLLKAMVYALLAKSATAVRRPVEADKSEPSYKQEATEEFDELKARSDISIAISFRAAIEEAEFFGPDEPNQFDTMPQQIAQAGLCDDIELIITAASLLRRQNRAEAFEKMIQLCPQVSDVVGVLALADLSDLIAKGQKPQQTSVFEVELAAKAAWADGPENHEKTLAALASEKKFQTPLLLYVTAIALEDSCPADAVELLINASTLQQTEPSATLDASPQELARRAAELAFKLFVEKKADCQTALAAFENYQTRTPEEPDDKLKYLNSEVYYQCGKPAEGRQLRRELAEGSEGYWRNRARLDLITETFEQKEPNDQIKRDTLAEELKSLIGESAGADIPSQELKKQAIALYCQLLLSSHNDESPQELNKLAEAAAFMAGTIEKNNCEYADEALELAAEMIAQIEQVQTDEIDPTQTVQDCRKMAQFAYDCLDGDPLRPRSEARIRRRAGIVLAEATIVATAGDEQVLEETGKLLDDLAKDVSDNEANYLRCRARLLTEQHKFADAAGLWSSIADMLKQEKTLPDGAGLPKERTWNWWQAKFYELYCCSRLSRTKAAEVLHAVEVLQNSYEHIPPPWAKKLQELKAQIK